MSPRPTGEEQGIPVIPIPGFGWAGYDGELREDFMTKGITQR